MGSCFSDTMGGKLGYYKFNTLNNPFGILFHPLAIEKLISRALDGHYFTKEDLFYENERWNCFEVHSKCSTADQQKMLAALNMALKSLGDFLVTASHIFITPGTAWVYRHTTTGNTVANCHKVPQKFFSKELTGIQQVEQSLAAIASKIKKVNPGANMVCTVSPVRHLKDGFMENQRSKAHLIAAVHQWLEGGQNRHYFPAYEILMDELRDYRFYADDMVHPGEMAINYIWEQFSNVWISPEAMPVMHEVGVIQSGLAHRPFDATSEAYRTFTENLNLKIKKLQHTHPFIHF